MSAYPALVVERWELSMKAKKDLVIAVEQLAGVRGRLDAVHSDSSTSGGGDGHGSSGGDGLNIPES